MSKPPAFVLAVLRGEDAAAGELREELRVRGVSSGAAEIAGSLGVLAAGAAPALPRFPARQPRAKVRIEALGAFRVHVAGREVPVSAWQSRKARDLVKLLLVRRGRPVPREALVEALWPDRSPDEVGGGLSAALSVARTVLDPDRSLPADHHLVGLSEALCGGDLLEDDPYEEWAAAAREECRAARLAVLRRLVVLAKGTGRVDDAVGYGLRLLALDPYDEGVHLDLVQTLARTRRHGEAHRHYRTYVGRMRELDIEPAPFPA